jgi:hypothetical protein
MPFIFIHGVNTRKSERIYTTNIATRDKLVQRRLLDPLAEEDNRFKSMKIVNPYWGDDGVQFMWGMASLPEVSILEHFGIEDSETPEADAEFLETVRALTGTPAGADPSGVLEGYGGDDRFLQPAATADLTRFMEAVLSPLLLSEMRMSNEAITTDQAEGELQALIAMAADDVANEPAVKGEVATAASDDEIMDLLKGKVAGRLEELAVNEASLGSPGDEPPTEELEEYGSGWLDTVTDRVGELFDRMKGAPGRVSTVSALDLHRERLHGRLSRFLGDVFVYLNDRGPIVSRVHDEIRQAVDESPDTPLVIITHSMGGNILYDILTWRAKDLHVDAWVSVGGQVAQFEEMKLFKASDKAVKAPQRVSGLKPRVRYWLNIYDPADTLGFKAAPVFADVDADIAYLTGASALKAHGAYFGRSSFYRLVRKHIAETLPWNS